MRWDEICIILRSHFRGSRLLFGKLILYVRFCRMFHANEGDPWILRYGKLILNEMERKHGKKRCNEKGEIIIWLWSILKSMTRNILNKFYY